MTLGARASVVPLLGCEDDISSLHSHTTDASDATAQRARVDVFAEVRGRDEVAAVRAPERHKPDSVDEEWPRKVHGWAWLGMAGHGRAWPGMAGHGRAWLGKAGHGRAWLGWAGLGWARLIYARGSTAFAIGACKVARAVDRFPLQHGRCCYTTCNIQHAACDIPDETYRIQDATCYVQHAICNMHHSTYRCLRRGRWTRKSQSARVRCTCRSAVRPVAAQRNMLCIPQVLAAAAPTRAPSSACRRHCQACHDVCDYSFPLRLMLATRRGQVSVDMREWD